MQEENTTSGKVTMSTGITLTFGQKAVGLTFNPLNDPLVEKAKQLSAELIDLCRALPVYGGSDVPEGERSKMIDYTVRQIQTAQMWAVKAITWKE